MFNPLSIGLPPALLILGLSAAHAGPRVDEAGAIACVNDKWDESEPDKGHKLVDYAGRCVNVPNDPSAEKVTEECVGKYEYLPDGSWTGAGTCTRTHKGGDRTYDSFAEGSQLKDYTYIITGGTGKYERATGGGTYSCENLTDTLCGGTYKGVMELP
jgi:hypothetical protein